MAIPPAIVAAAAKRFKVYWQCVTDEQCRAVMATRRRANGTLPRGDDKPHLSSDRVKLNNRYKRLLALTHEPLSDRLVDTIEVTLCQAFEIAKSPNIPVSEYMFIDRATDAVHSCYEHDSYGRPISIDKVAAKQAVDDLRDGLKLIFARYEKHC